MLRLDDAADRAGAHHLAEADRRNVRLALVHPSAHRRIERDVAVLHQQLAVAELAQLHLLERKVGRLDHPDGPGREREAMILAHHDATVLRPASVWRLPRRSILTLSSGSTRRCPQRA